MSTPINSISRGAPSKSYIKTSDTEELSNSIAQSRKKDNQKNKLAKAKYEELVNKTIMDGSISLDDSSAIIDKESSIDFSGIISKARAENKRLSDRNLKLEPESLMLIEEDLIDNYLNKKDGGSPDYEPTSPLQSFIDDVLDNPTQAHKILDTKVEDVTDKAIILQSAIHKAYLLAQSNISSEELEKLRKKLSYLETLYKELELSNKSDIFSGFNIINSADEYQKDSGDNAGISNFTSIYRGTLAMYSEQGLINYASNMMNSAQIHQSTLKSVYSFLRNKFGIKKVFVAMKHMMAAIGADIAATTPSSSSPKLRVMLLDAQLLQTTSNVLHKCSDINKFMSKTHSINITPEELTDDVINITSDPWVSSRSFENLIVKHKVTSSSIKEQEEDGDLNISYDLSTDDYEHASVVDKEYKSGLTMADIKSTLSFMNYILFAIKEVPERFIVDGASGREKVIHALNTTLDNLSYEEDVASDSPHSELTDKEMKLHSEIDKRTSSVDDTIHHKD